MLKRKSEQLNDPVLPDQGGRDMPGDPGTPSQEETVRQRAYELYVGRGCKDGFDLHDWLEAESQVVAKLTINRTVGTA